MNKKKLIEKIIEAYYTRPDKAAIATDPSYHVALYEMVIEGYTYQEIAEAFNISRSRAAALFKKDDYIVRRCLCTGVLYYKNVRHNKIPVILKGACEDPE